MTDLSKIAENYIAAWNETDAGRRRAHLEAAFTKGVSYRDPIMQGDGHDGLAGLIDGVQQRFAGFRFMLKGQPDGLKLDLEKVTLKRGETAVATIERVPQAAVKAVKPESVRLGS